MPITKIDTGLAVGFGEGDIRISPIHQGDEKLCGLALIQDYKSHPIGMNLGIDEYSGLDCKTKNDLFKGDGVVILGFNKIESLDALMKSLTELRTAMIGGKVE